MSQEWKLVPVVPTTAMVEVLKSRITTTSRGDLLGSGAALEEAIAAAPVPPAGGELKCWNCKADFTLSQRSDCDGCCWKCGNEIDLDDYVTRLQAEIERLRSVVSQGREDADEADRHRCQLQAENAALQQRLNVADQRIDELEADKRRLDALESEYWDVRHHSSPIADTGDHSTSIEIVGHWMDKPHERVIGENYNENLRAAIDQAMTADAYPPARPEYPELDAELAEDDWHMKPCKKGHRDVGACGGQAFCHTCDETITAATTQEAFEQWNATHPATPK